MTDKGRKDDGEKLRLDLFPFHVAISLCAGQTMEKPINANALSLLGHVSQLTMHGSHPLQYLGAIADALLRIDNQAAREFDRVIRWAELVTPVLEFGAGKYGAWNWYQGLTWSRIVAALQRHLAAMVEGENTDPETGLLHLQHALCNVIFLATSIREGKGLNDLPGLAVEDDALSKDISSAVKAEASK